MLRYCQQRAGEGRTSDASLNEMRARMTTMTVLPVVEESIEIRDRRLVSDETGAGMWRS